MNRKKYFGKRIQTVFTLCMLLLMHVSCNQEFTNVLPTSFNNDTLRVGDGSKRVLYIILDGVRGDVVRSLAPTSITAITQRAVYSYDGLADYRYNPLLQAAAWTTMMTGVDYTKHHVSDDNFTGFDNAATPTLFTRLKTELKSSARTVSIASSQAFMDKLAADATYKQQVSTDEAVKNAVIAELTNEDPTLVVAQFKNAEVAAANDYTPSNTAYVDAIQTLDGYIGEIMSALNNRKTYSKEGWLVIIASSRGGGPSGGLPGSNIYDDASRNTFVAFYSAKFRSSPYDMPDVDALPYVGTAPRFQSNNSSNNGIANQTNTAIGNFGSSGDYTMMFKIRNDGASAQYYPMFVGKRNPANTGVGTGGWSFLMGENSFQFDWGSSPRPGAGADFRDGVWHTIGITIYMEGSSRRLALFLDGVRRNVSTISGNHDNNFPLRLGTDQNWNTNLLIKDFVILNTALSEAEMITHMRREFGPNNPYFSNAMVWCPGNESSGNVMMDLSGKGNHFQFSPTIQFASFNDISPNISPNTSEAAFMTVPNGVDIPVMIYNWMNISVPSHWNLMGKSYTPLVNLPIE